MGSWAPPPHPLATFLLALDERAADGVVRVGARRIVIRRGKVVDVARVPPEPSVSEFLRQAGRIDDATFQRLGAHAEAPDVLVGVPLPAETLQDLVRVVWVDRLVRTLDEASPPMMEAARANAEPVVEVGLGLLVLDALERTGAADAEQVGARASGLVEWSAGTLEGRAQRWLGVEGKRARRVSGVLGARPGAAARLAALARAGLVRVVDDAALRPEPSSLLDMPRDSLPSVRPPQLVLAPGAAVTVRARNSIAPGAEIPRLPPASARLDDALEPLERKLARLEASGAPPAERARAFRALGDGWLRLHGAIDETARAYREAAALDKSDPELLMRTAEMCAGAGQLDVAMAYARAAVAAQTSPDGRGASLLTYALFCRRFDRPSEALGAARAAQGTGPASAEAFALAAELEEGHGLHAEAQRDLLEAAAVARESHPERAHAWLASAWVAHRTRAKGDKPDAGADKVSDAFATSLSALGKIDAALAVRAETVRARRDPEQRRRLLLSLAERAELAERPLAAVDFQLEVLETEPALEVVYDALDQDLETAGLSFERALVLEDLALRGPRELKGDLSVRAAEARGVARMAPEWTLVLVRRALALSVPLARLRPMLDALRSSLGPAVVADAIEEAASSMVDGTERSQLLDLLIQTGGGLSHGARRLAQAMRDRRIAEPTALVADAENEHRAISDAEARVARGRGSEKRSAALALAHLLAGTAAGRDRAETLLDEVLSEVPSEEAEDLSIRIALARADARGVLRAAMRVGARGGNADKRQRALMLALAAATELKDAGAARGAFDKLGLLRARDAEACVRARRLAARTHDVALEVEALRVEATLAIGPHAAVAGRARALARLAWLALEGGAEDQAGAAAAEALELLPTQGQAALVGLVVVARGQGTLPLVARVRALFGDVGALLAAEARLESDAAKSLAATVRWASLDPTSPDAPLTALEECLARGVDDYLEPGIHALLTDARAVPRAIAVVARAINRIAERSEPARAAELARRAAIYFGPEGALLRPMALDLGRREADPFHERAAMELMLPPRDAVVARAEHLERIAETAQKSGDRAAEVRALIRVLGSLPREPRIVARLAHLFAETGENDRLFATLEHAAEEGPPTERRRALLSLAAAASQILGSEEKTRDYLERLTALEGTASGPTEGALARADALVALGRASSAVDLLLEAARQPGVAQGAVSANVRSRVFERAAELAHRHLADPDRALAIAAEALSFGGPWTGRTLLLFEQLALEKRRTDLAEAVYARLVAAAMGERGRRALAYRHARWLERRGDKPAALAMLVRAATEAGAGGAVATAIERVARDVGDLDALARGYVALAEGAKHPVLRAGLVRRAVRVWEEETGQPALAFDALFAQWKETFSSEIEPDLARLANAVAEQDPDRGNAAFALLFAEIERRAADAWMGDEKARLLMKAARLHAARGSVERAAALGREAINALEGEDAELVRAADVWAELADFELLRGEDDAARAAVSSALGIEPENARALAMAARLGMELAPKEAPATVPSRAPAPASLDAPTSSPRSSPTATGSAPSAASSAPPAVAPEQPAPPTPTSHLPRTRTSAPPAVAASVPPSEPSRSVAPAAASAPEATSPRASSRPTSDVETTPDTTMETDLAEIHRDLEIEGLPLPLGARGSDAPLPTAPSAPFAVPEMLVDDADLPTAPRPSQRPSGAPLSQSSPGGVGAWSPLSSPPASRAQSLPPLARVASVPPPDGETPEEFALRLASSPETRAAGASVLRGMLMEDPGRFDVLAMLERVSQGAPELASAQRVASALVSLVDGHPRAPGVLALDVPAESLRGLSERLTQLGALTPVFDILERLVESLPMYRQSLGQLGVLGTDRVAAHGTSPISKALAHATLTGRGQDFPAVFLSSRPGGVPTVLRTSPAAVLLPLDWSRNETELRFGIARTAELARPRTVLLASLSEAEITTLFDAVRAAFGPADGARADKAAAQLAAELWRSLPVRVQRDVRELFANAGPSWDTGLARSTAFSLASRVGLIAAGDVRGAVTGLFRARSRGDIRLPDPESWRVRCAGDAELADLVRVAFSDEFLAAIRAA